MDSVPPTADDPSQSLCLGCGICCDGTLHPSAKVAHGEEALIVKVGLSLTEIKGKPFFRQPCPKFKGGCCSIYESRPAVCRTYQCALLENVRDGQISLSTAREKVEIVRALIVKVAGQAPAAVLAAHRSEARQTLSEQLSSADGDAKIGVASALLNIVALDQFLMRWFRKQSSPENPVP